MRPWLRCLWGKIINREAAPTRLQNPTHNTAAKNQITVSPVTGIHFNASNKITVVSSRERKKISLIRVFFFEEFINGVRIYSSSKLWGRSSSFSWSITSRCHWHSRYSQSWTSSSRPLARHRGSLTFSILLSDFYGFRTLIDLQLLRIFWFCFIKLQWCCGEFFLVNAVKD